MLPGDGIADLAAMLGALDAAGWDGLYDLEIFSDNGTFGTAYRIALGRPAADSPAGPRGAHRGVGAGKEGMRV